MDTMIDPVRHRAVLVELRNLVTAAGAANRATLALVRRLRSAGIPIAAYSACGATQPALAAAGIEEEEFTAFVDPSTVRDPDLPAPPAPDLLYEAARHLGALPGRTVVVEDSHDGVRAARNGGFGLVIGIDDLGSADLLHRAGADLVVADAEAILLTGRVPYSVAVCRSIAYTELRLTHTARVDRITPAIVQGVRSIFAVAQRAGLEVVGPPSATIDPEPAEEEVTIEFALPVVEPAAPIPGTHVVTTEPCLVARTVHTGSIGNLGPAHRALDLWLGESHYRAAGPRTETYFVGSGDDVPLDDLTIEVQIPVAAEVMITAERELRPAEATARLMRLLPGHGFELVTVTAPGTAGPERTLLLVRHPALAGGACAADPHHAPALLVTVVSIRPGGDGGSVVEILDPAVTAAALPEPTLSVTADRLRYLLTATLAALPDTAAPTRPGGFPLARTAS
ncbi:HAD family hydrolase [Nocardia farcinica]|uniref:HAD family hydrolase n=1 Tax=Nocardia farcinica TaxID=37329 RepID=UPI001893BFE5|nr:HAD family hydrolase [Nocardia farcinica]MBF6235024.1 hypothetical protein [Nocardia farcinica]MBF6445323.1 hypothetical protein [Nocardia farcinica]